jgi:hypothetical protein
VISGIPEKGLLRFWVEIGGNIMPVPLNGFVVLYRKFREWEWYTDSNTKDVFLELILTANFKDSRFKGYIIPRGSVVTSIHNLSVAVGLTDMKVRTALEHLKSTGEITIKTTSKFSIITINNYDFYQDDNTQNNNQITSKEHTDNNQITSQKHTNNNSGTMQQGNNKTKKQGNNTLSSDLVEETASFDFNSIVELFHFLCPSLEKVSRLTKKQKNDILKANTVLNGDFTSLFNRVEKSDFLKGIKGNWNGATFGWIFVPENLEKILSGRYDNKETDNEERKPNYDEEF